MQISKHNITKKSMQMHIVSLGFGSAGQKHDPLCQEISAQQAY